MAPTRRTVVRHGRRAALAVPLALLLAAGACSSSTDGSSSTTGTRAVPTSSPRGTVPGSVPGTARILLDSAMGDQLQRVVDATVEEFGVPGAAVLVVTPDSRWETVAGVSNLETKTPMDPGLTWPLRSVTKSFTVTLLGQLVDEGIVRLDDPVSMYVDGVPRGDEITLEQLAAMTSGLPGYTTAAFIDDFVADPERVFTDAELLAYAWAEPMQFEPGTKRVYTNTNTVLLGVALAKATGKPIDALMREKLLDPLGLAHTTYVATRDQWVADVTGYQPGDDGSMQAQPVNYSVFGASGAMSATLDDLATWGTALGTGSMLDPTTQTLRHEAAPLDKGPDYDLYGLGTGEVSGWWGHTGEGFGVTVLTMHDERTGATVAIAMNASRLGEHVPTVLFRRLVPVLYGQGIPDPLEGFGTRPAPPSTPAVTSTTVTGGRPSGADRLTTTTAPGSAPSGASPSTTSVTPLTAKL